MTLGIVNMEFCDFSNWEISTGIVWLNRESYIKTIDTERELHLLSLDPIIKRTLKSTEVQIVNLISVKAELRTI